MIRTALAVCLAAVTALSAASAFATCKLRFRDLDNVVFSGDSAYGVFDAEEASESEIFKVEAGAGDSCSFFVGFSSGGAGSYDRRMAAGGQTLSYQIYDSLSKDNALKDVPDANGSEVLSGVFGGGIEQQEFTFFVFIPPLQIKPPGRYTDSVKVTLYEGTLGNFTEHKSRNLRIRARLRPTVEASVVASGGAFDPMSDDGFRRSRGG
jgi:spore coat protein U-like protein